MILNCAKQNKNKLVIIGIGPLTPLADALENDSEGVLLENVVSVYLQGTVVEEGDSIKPGMDSYNFKQDKKAALKVFDYLSSKIPFRMLGKHTAYKVGIKIEDF